MMRRGTGKKNAVSTLNGACTLVAIFGCLALYYKPSAAGAYLVARDIWLELQQEQRDDYYRSIQRVDTNYRAFTG